MALVIRMRQQGTRSRQRFRIVLADVRSPRDGKYLENLGWYNPFGAEESNCTIDVLRIQHWMGLGAKVSDRVRALVVRKAPEVKQEWGKKKEEKRARARAKREKKEASPHGD